MKIYENYNDLVRDEPCLNHKFFENLKIKFLRENKNIFSKEHKTDFYIDSNNETYEVNVIRDESLYLDGDDVTYYMIVIGLIDDSNEKTIIRNGIIKTFKHDILKYECKTFNEIQYTFYDFALECIKNNIIDFENVVDELLDKGYNPDIQSSLELYSAIIICENDLKMGNKDTDSKLKTLCDVIDGELSDYKMK